MTDYEIFHKFLRHDPAQGKLWWKPRDRELFKSDKLYTNWNDTYSNTEAVSSDDGCGYRVGYVMNKKVKAHRVMWIMERKEIPIIVDHVNGVRFDNRIVNLRNVTNAENSRNRVMDYKNTSGISGVRFDEKRGKWRVSIGRERKHLGYFVDLDTAILARRKAEVEFGYHDNHGRRN